MGSLSPLSVLGHECGPHEHKALTHGCGLTLSLPQGGQLLQNCKIEAENAAILPVISLPWPKSPQKTCLNPQVQ